jgi:hypothetical protein
MSVIRNRADVISAAPLSVARRSQSQSFMRGFEKPWTKTFTYGKPVQADRTRGLPHPVANARSRKRALEWRAYHGHGMALGHMGPSREIPDWEHADGTPAPHSPARYAFLFHQHNFIRQAVEAGAAVERAAARGMLPRVPSTAVQRAWDPEVPLFLDDLDEAGAPPPPEFFVAGSALSRRSAPRARARYAGDLGLREMPGAPRSAVEATSATAYDPTSFINEPLTMRDKQRPYWNRRLWALTDAFLVQKATRNKNTIGTD